MGVPQNIMRALCAVIRPDHSKFASYGPALHALSGKLFKRALGNYVNMSTINRHQYSYLHSTSTGFTQPGTMYVKWSLPAKVSRAKGAKELSQQRVLTLEESRGGSRD